MSEEVKAKVKALFPEDVEGIYISKNDYDRLYGDLTLENIELKEEIERLNNIINNAIETIKDEGLVVAIKITNGEEETLLSSKELLLDILKGE